MRILILGGTVFLGRTIAEAALAAGHEVTLFNRGKSNPAAFKDVETITGDRTTDLDKLKGRTWDAVIDPSGYIPKHVGASAQALKDSSEHYTFISTISTYKNFSIPNMDESAPVGTLEDPTVETVTGETYGPLKVLCEQAAEAAMPGRVLSVRAGLIVGNYDPTDRFTYWPWRVQKGGDFVAPESPAYPMQVIDARDIADWVLHMAAARKGGVYNVTGTPTTLGDVISSAQRATGSDASPIYMDAEFLSANEVQPWADLPLWIPASDADHQHMHGISVAKALADGLTFRPLDATIAATLAWANTRPAGEPLKTGLSAEKEQTVLQAWENR
ncbi:MAG: epimerase [Anaerolineae bacterium]|jgi:2'-hydroxyisoflavone reductase|nr:epimerase [Anaerolineae bacterium]